MPDSPTSASPYDVLGVTATATTDELRRAYRRKLRETHPDTGGTAIKFDAVQRAWERIGTPEERAAYDRGRAAGTTWSADTPRTSGATSSAGTTAGSASAFTGRPSSKQRESAPTARSYGHPGGWRRERYLALIREWAGRGASLEDPYDPAVVRSAPAEIQHLLADAVAEEHTARTLSALGLSYTVWHDVATNAGSGSPEDKLDHIVLGPTGLFAILSEDWGGPITIHKKEIAGAKLAQGERPFRDLATRARSVTKATRVNFGALVIVVPDDVIADGVTVVGKSRGIPTVVVRRSYLDHLLRTGLVDTPTVDADSLYEARERLQRAIRFV